MSQERHHGEGWMQKEGRRGDGVDCERSNDLGHIEERQGGCSGAGTTPLSLRDPALLSPLFMRGDSSLMLDLINARVLRVAAVTEEFVGGSWREAGLETLCGSE